MAETQKRSSLGKKLGIVFGIILILVVVLYFVVTSTAFFKGVILPRVSKAVGADVTVADASISPFSRVELRQLKVQPPTGEPILQADQVTARYSLMDIIGGNITVHEVTLISPVIRIVEDDDGKSNVDAVTKSDQPAPEPGKDEAPPKLNISNITIKNGNVQAIKKHKDGTQEVTELGNLNLHIDQLRNGASSKIELASDVRMESASTNGTPNLLSGNLSGNFSATLGQDLSPAGAAGKAQFTAKDVSGDYADLRGLNAAFNVDLTPTEVKTLALQFARNGKALGEIRASGPLNLAKQEGKLNLEIASIDQNVLNLVGASKGMDFGSTKINSTNQIEISKGGQLVAIQGQLRADSFSVTQTNQTTPPVDLVAKYNVVVDHAAKSALISAFDLDATQKGQALMAGNLSKPMKLNWGAADGAVDESALSLTVTNLNLADWKAFAPELNAAGRANLNLNVLSKGAGKQLQFDLISRLSNFSAQSGSNKIDRADITLSTRGQIAEFDKVTLQESRIELAQGGERAAVLTVAGSYAVASGDANLKATVDAALPKVLQLVRMPDVEVRSGKLTFDGQIKQTGKDQAILGSFAINDLTGRFGDSKFQNYNITSDADIQKSGDLLTIRKLLVALAQGEKKGGTLEIGGNMNTATSIGSFDLKLNGLNETGLRPFEASSLGERKLNSVLVNGTVAAKINSTNSYAVTSVLDIANLVIVEPDQVKAPLPLSAKISSDLALQGDVTDIRLVKAAVVFGSKPAGSFELKGKFNSVTSAGQLEMSLVGLNENAVRPFMPKIGGKDLVRIAINGTASANLNSTTSSAVKADFKISDLVVKDPKQAQPDAPLSVQVQLDSTVTTNVYDLRQLQFTLSPTARAKNELSIKGRLDLSNTNFYQGDIVITSDSLDMTQFYNLYAATEEAAPAPKLGKPGAPAPKTPTTATGTGVPADANKESEPMKLPKGRIALTMNIGQLFLREIAITNLQANGLVATNRITLSPMQMTMNGGPAKADVDIDVGVPGYAYNLSFSADGIPLKPVVNSFMSEENKDQYQGTLLANGKIKGVGTTGVSLKKNLTGNMGFTFTNANIKVGSKLQPILNTIAAVLSVPEIKESPINWVDAQLQFGGGQIKIPRCIVESEALRASVQGNIPISDILTNSPVKLPVPVELRRSLARKLPKEIFVQETAPDSKYLQLPQFLIVKGTLGEPKPEADTKGFVKSAGVGIAKELIKDNVGGDAGKLLQGLLGSPKPAPAPTTAPPPNVAPKPQQRPQGAITNQPAVKPRPVQPTTKTNTSADTVNQILDIFSKPKK